MTHEQEQAQQTTTSTPPAADGMIQSVTNALKNLWHKGNTRQLLLKNKHGNIIMRLPLSVAVLLTVLLILSRLAAPALIVFIILMVMKYQFVLSREHDVEIIDPKD